MPNRIFPIFWYQYTYLIQLPYDENYKCLTRLFTYRLRELIHFYIILIASCRELFLILSLRPHDKTFCVFLALENVHRKMHVMLCRSPTRLNMGIVSCALKLWREIKFEETWQSQSMELLDFCVEKRLKNDYHTIQMFLIW